jgi:hypothetical protein
VGRFQSQRPSSGGTRADGAQELLTGGTTVSDDSKVFKTGEHEEPQDEVEAHRVLANDEPAQEGSDDEVEAHHHRELKPDNRAF